MKRRRTIAATAAQHKLRTRDEGRAEAKALQIKNLDAYIASALEQSSLMRLLDATGKSCGGRLRPITSKSTARARELHGRWSKRHQCIWNAIHVAMFRGLDTERWHSKIENLDAYIARALEQHSLVSVLEAIANACLVKAAQAVDQELQRQWSSRAHIVRDAANEIVRRDLGGRKTKHTYLLYMETPNSAGGIDWIRRGFNSSPKAIAAFNAAKSREDKTYGEVPLMGDCPRSVAVCGIFGRREH
jgi:hypothetical protein